MSVINGFKLEENTLTIDGHLNEEKMLRLMVILCNGKVLQQPKVEGTRMRYDAKVVLPSGETIIVDFDGDTHFRDANVIYRDSLKDAITKNLGIRVIRIPYFLQLDNCVFKHLFGIDFPYTLVTECKQGFTESTKMLPASFCNIGNSRYLSILASLPNYVQDAIRDSLELKCKDLPKEYVYFN